MKKYFALFLVAILAACGGDYRDPLAEVFRCGDYTVYVNMAADKTDDLSGGMFVQGDMPGVALDSSHVYVVPMINGGEVHNSTLKTPERRIVFQLQRYSDGVMINERRAIFNPDGLFRGENIETNCEFIGFE
jgi:hypothetical protein